MTSDPERERLRHICDVTRTEHQRTCAECDAAIRHREPVEKQLAAISRRAAAGRDSAAAIEDYVTYTWPKNREDIR